MLSIAYLFHMVAVMMHLLSYNHFLIITANIKSNVVLQDFRKHWNEFCSLLSAMKFLPNITFMLLFLLYLISVPQIYKIISYFKYFTLKFKVPWFCLMDFFDDQFTDFWIEKYLIHQKTFKHCKHYKLRHFYTLPLLPYPPQMTFCKNFSFIKKCILWINRTRWIQIWHRGISFLIRGFQDISIFTVKM